MGGTGNPLTVNWTGNVLFPEFEHFKRIAPNKFYCVPFLLGYDIYIYIYIYIYMYVCVCVCVCVCARVCMCVCV